MMLPTGSRTISEAVSVEGRGRELFDMMCAHDLEGSVAKRLVDPYEPRVRWLKVKTRITRRRKAGATCSTRRRAGGTSDKVIAPGANGFQPISITSPRWQQRGSGSGKVSHRQARLNRYCNSHYQRPKSPRLPDGPRPRPSCGRTGPSRRRAVMACRPDRAVHAGRSGGIAVSITGPKPRSDGAGRASSPWR